jgi:type III secretory pathway component EscR
MGERIPSRAYCIGEEKVISQSFKVCFLIFLNYIIFNLMVVDELEGVMYRRESCLPKWV